MRPVHVADKVRLDYPAMGFDGRFIEKTHYTHTDVVDPDVDRTMTRDGRFCQRLNGGSIRHVGGHHKCRCAQRLALLCKRLQRFDMAGGKDDVIALASKGKCCCPSDAARSACDDDNARYF